MMVKTIQTVVRHIRHECIFAIWLHDLTASLHQSGYIGCDHGFASAGLRHRFTS